MKNKGTKQKSKKKGSDNAFGCNLIEHLQSSGQDVPQVLKTCAEFIEEHGIVDGIYRLSGVTSNIQRLRQEFISEACPDLTKEVYLQDIHCVGSLCKLYFRELPNPLLTYELYAKFTGVVSIQGEHERLLYIQRVVKELPTPHFRTLEYLTKHLAHLATLSSQTNMHTRNLALVWAPNLLRSKDIETLSGNGDMAFQAVRIQQSVVEFILNHREQIFSSEAAQIKPKEGSGLMCAEKYATLPISSQCGPMKLMSLEEAQARSLSPNHPVHKERQRENSLPDTSTAMLYHTVIDVSDSKRKLSGKSKKWRSIFNLGRSVDPKGKLSRNGSVFIRASGAEKTPLRPSRSMESLCSLPTDDDRTGSSSAGGIFSADVKSRTLGSDSLFDLSEHEENWEFKGIKPSGATGGWSSDAGQKGSPGTGAAPLKTLPEQLKVYKGEDLGGYKPTSPKSRRMLYSHNSSSRPSFPGSFFPLESSPRHQRRAVNISEPFAVSVPLRVSAVISSNSTPCRGHVKDKAATLKPCRESSGESSDSAKSNSLPRTEVKRQDGTEKNNTEESPSSVPAEDATKEVVLENRETNTSELELPSLATPREGRETAPHPGREQHHQSISKQMEMNDKTSCGKEPWSELHQDLKITEPEIELLDETFKPVFGSKSTNEVAKLTMDMKSKRSRSSPSLSLLFQEQYTSPQNHVTGGKTDCSKKQPSESNLSVCHPKKAENSHLAGTLSEKEKKLHQKTPSSNEQDPGPNKECQLPSKESCAEKVTDAVATEETPSVKGSSTTSGAEKQIPVMGSNLHCDRAKKGVMIELDAVQRLSVCLEERQNATEIQHLDNDEGSGGNSEELDLVEPWEDITSTKQWVTSPLHSPDIEELFNQLSPFASHGETIGLDNLSALSPSTDEGKQPGMRSTEHLSGNIPHAPGSKPKTNWTYLPLTATRVGTNGGAAQPHVGKNGTAKQKNAAASQRFHRQMSYEAAAPEKREENYFSKHRPYSLNLDAGHRCIRDISNQQNRDSSEFSSGQRGFFRGDSLPGTASNGLPSELELFLSDGQAPLRRNSAPVSVSSVRTAFMIKTCQAKAVPVIPPRVQYSQIPHSRHEDNGEAARQQEKEKERPKVSAEKGNSAAMLDLKEELENKEPSPKHQRHHGDEKSCEPARTAPSSEVPVIPRRPAPSLEVFVECPRVNRPNLLQRPSFRNRQRPQSLILLSPPFPIMDYQPSGDDSKLLSSIKSMNETQAGNALSREVAEGITLQNKMTIPKSGQRLETSTSCFYQPQRRSMIFESRNHRQIE